MICSGVSRALATLSSLTCAKCTSSTYGTGARTAGPSGLVGAQRLGRERGMQRGYACMCVALKKFLQEFSSSSLSVVSFCTRSSPDVVKTKTRTAQFSPLFYLTFFCPPRDFVCSLRVVVERTSLCGTNGICVLGFSSNLQNLQRNILMKNSLFRRFIKYEQICGFPP